jgi:photosynthetic reaction center cytochrome c subunit
MPATQVIPTMQFITSSLGVDCEFCHDMKAFDKDTKEEKRTAREMIAMQNGINKGHFNGKREVTCNSCHHGAMHPASVPALPELNAAVPERVHEHEAHKLPEVNSPTQYLDDFYKAAGGEAALAKVTSRTERGSVSFGSNLVPGNPSFAFESYTRSSGERSSAMAFKAGTSLSVFDGHTGWLVNPGRPSREMSPGEVEAARVEAEFEFPVSFKQRYSQFKVARPEVVNGKQANVLVVSRPGQPPVRLYFDANSHLLLRVLYHVETPLGRNPTQIDVTSYADASGVAMPQHWIVTRPTSRATFIIESSDNSTPIDDDKFVPSAATRAAEH